MTYTHAFILGTKTTVTIDRLREILNGADLEAVAQIRAFGFWVIHDMEKVIWDRHGRPSRNGGGWSYGHIQNGSICAGAGGLNSQTITNL